MAASARAFTTSAIVGKGALHPAEGQRKERHEGGIERGGGAQYLLARVEDQPLPGKQVLGVTEGDERVVDRARAGEQPRGDGEGGEQEGR